MDVENYKEVFSKRLREARAAAGLTQQELAKQMGFNNATTISLYENARAVPALDQLLRLSQILRVPLEHLLDLSGIMPLQQDNGFAWVVSKPHPKSPYSTPELDEAITLFELIVRDSLTTREIQQRYPSFARHSDNSLAYLLKTALFSHTIQVVNILRDQRRENALKKKYNLTGCIVAALEGLPTDSVIDRVVRTEAIAFLAARDAIHSAEDIRSVGVLGGSIMSRFADLLQPASPRLKDITWVSMIATAGILAPVGLSANGVVERIVYTQPGAKGYRLPYVNAARRDPNWFRDAQGQDRDELERALYVLFQGQNVQMLFMSCGALMNMDPEGVPFAKVLQQMSIQDRERVKGDVMLRLIDEDGQRVGTAQDQADNDAFVYSISHEDLRVINRKGVVWIVAGEVRKTPVIRGALVSGLANSLVVEPTIADALLAYP